VKTPQGHDGRPSKSFTLEQAKALLAASEGTRLHAHVVLSLLVGIRTEEARRCAGITWWPGWMIRSDGKPVTAAGFARAGRARIGARSMSGAPSVMGRYQDREVEEDPGVAAALRGGAGRAHEAAGEGAAERW
jgi:hypothetical protein